MTETMMEWEHVADPGSRIQATNREETKTPAPQETVVPDENYTVPVREHRADQVSYHTSYIGSGNYRRILGRNDKRRSVTISAVAGSVMLASSEEMAAAANSLGVSSIGSFAADIPAAFILGGNEPGNLLTLHNTGEIWGVSMSGTSAMVTTIEEWFDE